MDKSSPYRKGLSKAKDSLALQKKKKSKALNDKSATLEGKETTESREKPLTNETQPLKGLPKLEEGEKPNVTTVRESEEKGAGETGPGTDQQKSANH